jgi:hypothetical protein
MEKGGVSAPLLDAMSSAQRFLAALFLRAGLRAVAFLRAGLRAADFFLRAGLRAADFFAVLFLRAGLRAADFFAVLFFLRAGLRAAVFLRPVVRFLVAAAFLPAVFRRAVVLFLVAAAFLPAADRFAAVRFRVAADFFAAADRFAAGLFRAAVFLAAIPVPLSSVVTKGLGLRRHPFEAPSFPFAHPAPHAVSLIATKRVVEALDPNGAFRADAFGLPGRSPLLGEEDLRVVISTPRPFLPWDVVMHVALPPKSHTCDSEGRTASLARGNFR